jgi:hypothetical protein
LRFFEWHLDLENLPGSNRVPRYCRFYDSSSELSYYWVEFLDQGVIRKSSKSYIYGEILADQIQPFFSTPRFGPPFSQIWVTLPPNLDPLAYQNEKLTLVDQKFTI